MKWLIPAKTFLLGEYAAIAGSSALVLTTSPCFELSVSQEPGLQGIHPDSPAGRWWSRHGDKGMGLHFYDPYQGRGGMGASSAQFVGVYQAARWMQASAHTPEDLLTAYLQSAWDGRGLSPSGYDVWAQILHGCVYLNRQQQTYHAYEWPFPDLAFVLLHTGQKLATHHHLQTATLPKELDQLAEIVESAKFAIESVDSSRMIRAVNAYHQQLMGMHKVAKHSVRHIESLQKQPQVLAMKGCGAMGADVLLLLVPASELALSVSRFSTSGWEVLATSDDLYVTNQN